MELLHGLYVLHSRPYRDTSVLIRVFSREWGIFSAIAKGGLGKGELQPFRAFSAQCSGKGNLKTLYNPEGCGVPYLLPPQSALCGIYANELVLATCAEQDAHPQLFDRYEFLLASLATSTWSSQCLQITSQDSNLQKKTTRELTKGTKEYCDTQSLKLDNKKLYGNIARSAALRNFEWELLRDIGYEVNFTKDSQAKTIEVHNNYVLSQDWIFHLTYGDGYRGEHLLAISCNQYHDKQTRQQAKKLSREMIGRIASKKLNSWTLFI